MELPKILNMGSGKNFRDDCVNIDKNIAWKPDIVFDLNLPIGVDGAQAFETKRFGWIVFNPNMFDRIIASDVLEHIEKLVVCMESCLRLLKVGGVMEIIVPYDLSLGAWQDPNHVRAFNQNSWLYYTKWAWYLGWEKERFNLVNQEYLLSEIGQKMASNKRSQENIMDIPRTVDKLRVRLEKITTEKESK
jgi:SAM-dependent methyltransferase